MEHIVLLGDSIFDNAPYVAPGAEVAAQPHSHLRSGYRVSLLARDGAVLAERVAQVAPAGAACAAGQAGPSVFPNRNAFDIIAF
jgi:hypothetical protein